MEDEMIVYLTDYLGEMVPVPESKVDEFLAEQAENKRKYGDRLPPEVEARLAAGRERQGQNLDRMKAIPAAWEARRNKKK